MACTLSARGKNFDVEPFLARTKLPVKKAHFWIQGTPSTRRRPAFHHDSGFSEWVSHDRWDDLSAAVTDVLKFLRKNKLELAKLKRARGVKEIMLDFAINSHLGIKDVAMQGEYLPPELLRRAGELEIGIGLSIYPPFTKRKATKRKNASKSRRKQRAKSGSNL